MWYATNPIASYTVSAHAGNSKHTGNSGHTGNFGHTHWHTGNSRYRHKGTLGTADTAGTLGTASMHTGILEAVDTGSRAHCMGTVDTTGTLETADTRGTAGTRNFGQTQWHTGNNRYRHKGTLGTVDTAGTLGTASMHTGTLERADTVILAQVQQWAHWEQQTHGKQQAHWEQ